MTPPGPPGPPGPTHPPGHPPAGPPRPRLRRWAALALLVISALALVLTAAWVLTPTAEHVWTSNRIPAADRQHYGDLLIVTTGAVACLLYLLVSLATPTSHRQGRSAWRQPHRRPRRAIATPTTT